METVPDEQAASALERFSELAERILAPLQRYAVRRTDPETAQDIVSDAMLVIWRRLDDVPTDDPLPWCYGVARRCLANAERAAQRRYRLLDKIAGQLRPIAESPPTLLDVDLDLALAALSPAERELVRLWAWEELSPSEIAASLGISANAARIRLHRARRKLAGLLGGDSESQRNAWPHPGQKQVNQGEDGG